MISTSYKSSALEQNSNQKPHPWAKKCLQSLRMRTGGGGGGGDYRSALYLHKYILSHFFLNKSTVVKLVPILLFFKSCKRTGCLRQNLRRTLSRYSAILPNLLKGIVTFTTPPRAVVKREKVHQKLCDLPRSGSRNLCSILDLE